MTRDTLGMTRTARNDEGLLGMTGLTRDELG